MAKFNRAVLIAVETAVRTLADEAEAREDADDAAGAWDSYSAASDMARILPSTTTKEVVSDRAIHRRIDAVAAEVERAKSAWHRAYVRDEDAKAAKAEPGPANGASAETVQ